MPSNLTANVRAFGELAVCQKLLSSLCHEIGLAAVAFELNVDLSALDHDVAEAIERGAAALFDAGYRPSPIGRLRSARADEKDSHDKVRRQAGKAKQSRPFAKRKRDVDLRHETNAVTAG